MALLAKFWRRLSGKVWIFRELAAHPETEISANRVRKESPDLEFSGGPCAEMVMELYKGY